MSVGHDFLKGREVHAPIATLFISYGYLLRYNVHIKSNACLSNVQVEREECKPVNRRICVDQEIIKYRYRG